MHLSGAMGLPRRMPDAPDLFMHHMTYEHAVLVPHSLYYTMRHKSIALVLRVDTNATYYG